MNSEFKSSYCSSCLNKRFDLKSGLSCGLESQPSIVDNTCSDYSPNQEHIERTNFNNLIARKKESKKTNLENYKIGLLEIIVTISLLYLITRWSLLESDYRYTLADVHVTHQSGSDFGGYKCEFDYIFKLNGRIYYNKGNIGEYSC